MTRSWLARILRSAATALDGSPRLTDTGDIIDAQYRGYLDERNSKTSLSERQAEFLDKSLLTLGGGALGLLLTFLHDHGERTTSQSYAIWGIALLIISVLSVLISVVMSQRSISRQIDALDDWCRSGFSSASEKPLQSNPWAGATLYLNRIAIFTFIAGVIAISSFVVLNLQPAKGSEMSGQGNGAKTPIERGVVISPPPAQKPQPANNQGTQKK